METTIEKRIAMMRKIGFRETTFGLTGGMTDGTHNIRTDWSMTDDEFMKYFAMISETKINAAKNYLESQGYCVRNLWHVNDVDGDMPDSEKINILEQALVENSQGIFMSIESITNNHY